MEYSNAMATSEIVHGEPGSQYSCKIKKQKYTVTVTSSDLSWQQAEGKKELKSVRISEILSAKIQKSRDKDILLISYVQQQKNFVLKKYLVEFTSDDLSSLEGLGNQITQLISQAEQRPKSLLVIVNPVSGRSNGRSVYTKTVAPVFLETGIKTDVKVTERAHHTEEILSTYDLSSIDGLVLVGGDGLYHEAVNGLLRRLAKEKALNIDDVDCETPEINVPLGLIPAGTGNGIANACYGNYDVQTAAISIAIGFRTKINILSLHSAGRLISYCVLLVGYGMWGDIIHVAESRRSQGRMRYPITLGEFALIRRLREFQVTTQYLWTDKNNQDVTETSSPEADSQNKAENNSAGWKSSTERITGNFIFFNEMDNVQNEKLSSDYSSIYMTRPCSKLKIFQFFVNLARKNLNAERPEIVSHKGHEWKVTLDNPSDPASETGISEHRINVDGEAFVIPTTEYHVKLLTNKVTLFSNMPFDTGRC